MIFNWRKYSMTPSRYMGFVRKRLFPSPWTRHSLQNGWELGYVRARGNCRAKFPPDKLAVRLCCELCLIPQPSQASQSPQAYTVTHLCTSLTWLISLIFPLIVSLFSGLLYPPFFIFYFAVVVVVIVQLQCAPAYAPLCLFGPTPIDASRTLSHFRFSFSLSSSFLSLSIHISSSSSFIHASQLLSLFALSLSLLHFILQYSYRRDISHIDAQGLS